MRNIKFRVWDKYEEKMYYNVGIVENRILLEYEDIEPDDNSIESTSYVDVDEDNEKYFEIMQYTGVKDYKGNEIYQGDIVRFFNDDDYILKPGKAEVCFNLGAFCMKHFKYGTEPLRDMEIEDMFIKVVGNIYENPELLKE